MRISVTTFSLNDKSQLERDSPGGEGYRRGRHLLLFAPRVDKLDSLGQGTNRYGLQKAISSLNHQVLQYV